MNKVKTFLVAGGNHFIGMCFNIILIILVGALGIATKDPRALIPIAFSLLAAVIYYNCYRRDKKEYQNRCLAHK